MIFTDAEGRPIEAPTREDYSHFADYCAAVYAFHTKVADVANRAFDDGFKKALRRGK